MARKTYHHLTEGDRVVLQQLEWPQEASEPVVVRMFNDAEVLEVKARTLKIRPDWKDTVVVISRQSGVEWGAQVEHQHHRIAPAMARPKTGAKPYDASKVCKNLPSLRALRDYGVYPGHPMVSAAYIMHLYSSPEEAALRSVGRDGTRYSWYAAEGHSEIPGAGGVASHAVDALLDYRKHGSIDKVINAFHDYWDRLVGPGTDNHEKAWEPGKEAAARLEPMVRADLKRWLK